MKPMNTLLLSLTAGAVSLSGNAMAGTILVDFSGNAALAATPASDATAADFAAFDSNVDLSAGVFVLNSNDDVELTGVAISGGTGDLIGATIVSSSGVVGVAETFNAGFLGGNPILNDFAGRGNGGSNIALTLGGLAAVEAGSTLTLTVFGVGNFGSSDATVPSQDSSINATYNSVTENQVTTAADTGAVNDAAVQFSFTAVDGVDEIFFEFSGSGADARNFAGFSVTSAPIPEPASLALIGLGSLAMLGRRRKAQA